MGHGEKKKALRILKKEL